MEVLQLLMEHKKPSSRIGRRPVYQGPRSQGWNQRGVKKYVTGSITSNNENLYRSSSVSQRFHPCASLEIVFVSQRTTAWNYYIPLLISSLYFYCSSRGKHNFFSDYLV